MIKVMATLILVRHGQSVYNLENRFTGSLYINLTKKGRLEAQAAGKKLRHYNFDCAYTSTLKRAQESLRIMLSEMHQTKIKVIENSSLNERDYGSLQGANKEEIIAKYGKKQVETWRRSFAIRPPEGESLEDTFKRTVPFYQQKIEPQLKHQKNVLIVAHGNSLRALVMYLENISKVDIVHLNIPTGVPKQYIFDVNLKILEMKYV